MEEDKPKIEGDSAPVAAAPVANNDAAGIVKEEQKAVATPTASTTTTTTATSTDAKPENPATTSTTTTTTEVPATAPVTTDGTTTATTSPATATATGNTDRKAWDYSNRKVLVQNVMKYMNKRDVKKTLAGWTAGTNNKIVIAKTKKPPKNNWMVLTLEKEEQVPILIEYINGNELTNKKGERIVAKICESNQGVNGDDDDRGDDRDNDNNNRNKRGGRDNNNDDRGNSKRQRVQRAVENAKPRIITIEEVKDAILPLWKSTYAEQLQEKEREMVKKSAVKIVKEVKDKFRQLEREAKRNKDVAMQKPYSWLMPKRSIEIAPILHAKDIVRNKCEFTFGYRYLADPDAIPVVEETSAKEEAAVEEKAPAAPENTTTEDTSGEDAEMKESPEAMPAATDKVETVATDTETTMDTSAEATAAAGKDAKSKEEEIPIKKIPSVGAMAKGWSGGVSHPIGCRNIPSEAMALIQIVETFLADCPMPPYHSKEHQGFWRTLAIRSSRRTKECMLIFVHAPLTGGAGSKNDETIDNYTPEVFESEKARLLSMITGKKFTTTYPKLEEDGEAEPSTDEKDTVEVTSVYFQEYDGVSMPAPDHPVQHIFGTKALKEKLGQCTFQISPGAFFQVNTKTAEILYNVVVEKVKEVATKPEETLCFDVCCGTGTIGLTLMKEGAVGRVVGVDISAPAIEDAKINAELNGFGSTGDSEEDKKNNKTRWVASRAEHVMAEEMKKARKDGYGVGESGGKVVAVVDPAREGLHSDVVRALRGFTAIDRLVYVSCNPTGSLVKDAGLLCCPSSKRYRGRAFRPSSAQPVDMFPYSSHCEMVVVFDRLTDEELDGQAE